jgi:hypothetical protein
MPTTTNYGWTTPTVGGDPSTWGGILNTAIQSVDTSLHGVQTTAAAALPRAGGTMTGRVDLRAATMALQSLPPSTGAVAIDLSLGQYIVLPVSGAVTLSFTNVAQGSVATGVILQITGGSAGVFWPANTHWSEGVAPSLSSGTDIVAMMTANNGGTWRAVLIGRAML